MDIGENVKKMREEQRLSQKDLSLMAGVQQSTISYIECGEKNPSVDTAIKIAEALGVDLNTLAGVKTVPYASNEEIIKRISQALNVDIRILAELSN